MNALHGLLVKRRFAVKGDLTGLGIRHQDSGIRGSVHKVILRSTEPGEYRTIIEPRHCEPARTLVWQSPKVSGCHRTERCDTPAKASPHRGGSWQGRRAEADSSTRLYRAALTDEGRRES